MTDPASVLVVDDDAEPLAPLVSALTPAGLHIHPVSHGDSALAAAATHPPDLILLSFRGSGPDGLDGLRRLKADKATRRIPVLLIAAATDTEGRLAALRAAGGGHPAQGHSGAGAYGQD